MSLGGTKLYVAVTENENNFLLAQRNSFIVVYVKSDSDNLCISATKQQVSSSLMDVQASR